MPSPRFQKFPCYFPVIAGNLLLALPAYADESPFASIYTAEVLPEGAKEFEQWVTWKNGKPGERFNNVTGRTEVEYGISNRFLLSLYANYSHTNIDPHGPGAPDSPLKTTRFTGFSAEAIYQILNPYTDPFGFALYAEPSMGAGERALEFKAIFQKNFLDDTFILAANVNVEYEWVHDVAARDWEHETGLEFYVGASYRVAPGWFAGAEFLNENGYSGHLLFQDSEAETNAYYLGPAIHYAAPNWWATLAVYEQLPWAGNPAHAPGAISHGRLAGSEKWRVRLRIGVQI